MNPLFQALCGGFGAMQNGGRQNVQAMAGGLTGGFQGGLQGGLQGGMQNILQRARQIASGFQNPQQFVRQYFPDVPADVSGDPEQIIGWLQQTGRVNPQMVQMARQLMGR